MPKGLSPRVKCKYCDRTGRPGGIGTHTKFMHSSDEQYQETFFAKVDKNAPGGCWLWTGCLDSWGRGALSIRGRRTFAHIISWEILRGIPRNGLHLCHTCDVRHCCNPEHLYLGTDADNNRDMRERGRAKYTTRAKLTEDQVREIRRDWTGKNAEELAGRYRISPTTIYNTATRRTWKNLP